LPLVNHGDCCCEGRFATLEAMLAPGDDVLFITMP
jgi:hypothetical protein